MNLDVPYMLGLVPILLKYLPVTLFMSVLATLIALVLGVSLALAKVLHVRGLVWAADLTISFLRGTPLLVQLFLFYYGLPQILPPLKAMTAFWAAVFCLSLHFGAYMAESIRGAILSVDRSQMEASLSVGMTRIQAMRRIILPQAARAALPPLMNNFIDLLKSTSLAFTLGVAEIMGKAQIEASSSFNFFESFLLVAFFYWAIVASVTRLQVMVERKMNEALG